MKYSVVGNDVLSIQRPRKGHFFSFCFGLECYRITTTEKVEGNVEPPTSKLEIFQWFPVLVVNNHNRRLNFSRVSQTIHDVNEVLQDVFNTESGSHADIFQNNFGATLSNQGAVINEGEFNGCDVRLIQNLWCYSHKFPRMMFSSVPRSVPSFGPSEVRFASVATLLAEKKEILFDARNQTTKPDIVPKLVASTIVSS